MTNAWVVRAVTAADLTTARAALALFRRAFEEADGEAPSDEHLAAWLATPTQLLRVVVDAQGAVLGAASAFVLSLPRTPVPEVYLYDLAVDEAHRRQGIATALIQDLRRHAGACGAACVYVQADAEDDAALALYARLGHQTAVYHFQFQPV
ncbi:MAG: GNAT family N-acetyltransferase [Alphaproteobacteria bacterium]|nr:GNAT family N-acetyltransferase [Alphaproteobacteria bacterium]TAD90709.1 MAG: GNAT family N-acetyltransferase [Alphaproteobacteria bacterium]